MLGTYLPLQYSLKGLNDGCIPMAGSTSGLPIKNYTILQLAVLYRTKCPIQSLNVFNPYNYS